MDELERQDVVLKRLRLARDYFLCVPEERVDLGKVTCGAGEFEFRRTRGFDALKCDAIACLCGWLYTLPEYIDWCAQRGMDRTDCMAQVEDFLGVSAPVAVALFAPRYSYEYVGRYAGWSDKQVALSRLDALIGDQ